MIDILTLKDKYKDKKAIIMGSGPSLRNVKASEIFFHSTIVIAVNASILKFDSPKFFLTDDKNVRYWSYYNDAVNSKDTIKVINKSFITPQEMIRDDFLALETTSTNKIDTDKFISAKTSLGTALSFSHYLGCKTHILLGVDCCLAEGKRYFWEFENYRGHEFSPRPKCKRSLSSEKIRISENQDNVGASHLGWWNKFKDLNPEMNIINCTEGSLIEAFPKMSIRDGINL